MILTYEELLSRVANKDALEERAAIIQFESGGKPLTREEAEKEAVRQWLAAEPAPKKQASLFNQKGV